MRAGSGFDVTMGDEDGEDVNAICEDVLDRFEAPVNVGASGVLADRADTCEGARKSSHIDAEWLFPVNDCG